MTTPPIVLNTGSSIVSFGPCWVDPVTPNPVPGTPTMPTAWKTAAVITNPSGAMAAGNTGSARPMRALFRWSASRSSAVREADATG
jgi:hypothetical protein